MLQSIKTRLNCTGYVESLIGGREENQDSAASADTPLGTLVVICDGMGGLKGGKLASSMAVDIVIGCVSSAKADDNPSDVLRNSLEKANHAIWERSREDSAEGGMGTTIAALLINEKSAFAVHVGDSRIYQLDRGGKIFRTDDHSMVFDMVRAKVITEEQARLSSCSNVIMKALGISDKVEPDIVEIPYMKGDRFVLCTDGFWAAMDEDSLVRSLSGREKLDFLLSSLAAKVDEIGKKNGGKHDNLTVAIIDMHTNSILKDVNRRKRLLLKVSVYSLLAVSLLLNIYALGLFFKISEVRSELDTLRNDLQSAQEYLTSQKISKILERLDGGGKMPEPENGGIDIQEK